MYTDIYIDTAFYQKQGVSNAVMLESTRVSM